MRKGLLRIFLSSLVMTVALMMAIILSSYTLMNQVMRQQNSESAHSAVEEALGRAQIILRTQSSMVEAAAEYNAVIQFLSGDPMTQLSLRDNVRSLLNNCVSFADGSIHAYLISAEGSWIGSNISDEWNGPGVFMVSRRIFETYHLEKSFRTVQITKSFDCDGSLCYAVAAPVFRAVVAPKSTDYLGTVMLILRADTLASAFSSTNYFRGFLRSEERFICGDEQAFDRWKMDETGMVGQRIPGTQWHFELMMDTEKEVQFSRQIRQLCIAVAMGAFAVLALLTYVQYKSMVHPILDIVRQTEQIKQDGDSLAKTYPELAEFNQLTDSINDMLLRVKQLRDEVLETRLMYYEEQIAFLQVQINPHFLFNTFECIRGMAAAGQMEAVRTATSGMARIYRYCAVKEPLVPLSDEYECLNSYIQVMNLRYGPLYHLHLEGSKEALRTPVPRMCLQPLVENALAHGYKNRAEKGGNVYIHSDMENGALHMAVWDDGNGMTEEELLRYNDHAHSDEQSTQNHSHIGITNVTKRFKLLFPERCTIAFSKAETGGLRIDMVIRSDRAK